jgi:glutaminase
MSLSSTSPHTDAGELVRHAELAAERGRRAALAGAVSRQIPELAGVDGSRFGLAVALLDGTEVAVGDATLPFSLQSLTKLFALCALLREEPRAWEHVGWDASGAGYGSVSELELYRGRPRNPFVNSGALVVTDRLLRHTGDAPRAVVALLHELSGHHVEWDPAVAASEAAHDHRNRAIAHVLAEHNRLFHDVDVVLPQYFAQCAITASPLTVARACLFLAARGNSQGPLPPAAVRRVNAVLLTAGMYGAAGDIAYRIGLPAKSGIGGGVLAVMPGVGAICVSSPPLDETGNSLGAVVAIEEFAQLAGWSVF